MAKWAGRQLKGKIATKSVVKSTVKAAARVVIRSATAMREKIIK